MHRALERLDTAASTIVPLLYLAGLMAGTLSYFADVQLGFVLTVGIALAFAAELHSFLALRRCRAIFAQFTRAALGSEQRERLAVQMRVHVAILGALVAFSTWNSIAFVASTWTPARGWLPAWVQIGIRGGIIPAFFLLAAFLSPLHADAGALLAAASHDMLRRTIRATVKQWKRRVETARRRGLDLAPIAVALMLDAGDTDGARRVQMIAEGLAVAEGISSNPAPAHATDAPDGAKAPMTVETHPALTAPASAPTDAQTSAPGAPDRVPDDAPQKPPTGPGSPAAIPARASKRAHSGVKRTRVLRVLPENANAEQRIRALLKAYPALSIRTLAKRADVAESTASKWRGIIAAELERDRFASLGGASDDAGAAEVTRQVAQ